MDYEDKALELERRFFAEAASDYLGAIDNLRRALRADSPEVTRILRSLVPPTVGNAAVNALRDAVELGHDTALAIVRQHESIAKANEAHDAAHLVQPAIHPRVEQILNASEKIPAAIDRMNRALTSGESAEDAAVGVLAATNSFMAASTVALNGAANDASIDVANAVEVDIVWIAERDACVDCAAYSGTVISSSEQFPGGLTFGDKTYFTDPLDGPPLHPNCRCHVEPSYSQDFADGLQREAQRSILRGIALPSESNAARLRAAQNVLNMHPTAPKSVIKTAQNAIKRGAFPPQPNLANVKP